MLSSKSIVAIHRCIHNAQILGCLQDLNVGVQGSVDFKSNASLESRANRALWAGHQPAGSGRQGRGQDLHCLLPLVGSALPQYLHLQPRPQVHAHTIPWHFGRCLAAGGTASRGGLAAPPPANPPARCSCAMVASRSRSACWQRRSSCCARCNAAPCASASTCIWAFVRSTSAHRCCAASSCRCCAC